MATLVKRNRERKSKNNHSLSPLGMSSSFVFDIFLLSAKSKIGLIRIVDLYSTQRVVVEPEGTTYSVV